MDRIFTFLRHLVAIEKPSKNLPHPKIIRQNPHHKLKFKFKLKFEQHNPDKLEIEISIKIRHDFSSKIN